MPALQTSFFNALITRDNITTNSIANATGENVLQVVCAWPVSGQYGAGSRVLYYVLVATCVFARKTEWLRNPCLAAALLVPLVSALHGIVLAALHVDDAVDMDIYGAFQLCAIGILAAPVTVRLSRTYFLDPGRNIIFLWTGIILAGLLSLVVEFYRSNPVDCSYASENPISEDHLNDSSNPCRLRCSQTDGPFSPLRQGAANEIFIIHAPTKLTFSAATLLAAACCIPAILSLIFTWNKIVEINWKKRFSPENEDPDELIEGTNGATIGGMRNVNNIIRMFLSTFEIPFFSAAVLAILIIGEQNFFSSQVSYQTEPIQSVGQWAPIIGTVLAALGSLYLLVARARVGQCHCTCSQHHSLSSENIDRNLRRNNERPSSVQSELPVVHHYSPSAAGGGLFITASSSRHSPLDQKGHADDNEGFAGKVARGLTRFSTYLGNVGAGRFDDSGFRLGRAVDFPEIPAERARNPFLSQIKDRYDPPRDSNGNATPRIRGQSSGLTSDAASDISVLAINESPSSLSQPIPNSQTPFPVCQKPRANTLPSEGAHFEAHGTVLTPCASLDGGQGRPRRDTLEVPLFIPNYHHNHPNRNNTAALASASDSARLGSHGSPRIVISTEPDPPPPVHLVAQRPADPP
ncbi:hypothetical protein F4810DRAFT_722723 [Camillea tinctor]|nr:hypothetical protein F4810DRAFT_722723 [Camillea tinctor]